MNLMPKISQCSTHVLFEILHWFLLFELTCAMSVGIDFIKSFEASPISQTDEVGNG